MDRIRENVLDFRKKIISNITEQIRARRADSREERADHRGEGAY